MYAREEAKEHRSEVLLDAIRSIRLGTIVLADDDGLPQAAHIPFVLNTTGDEPVLEAHVARGNPIWRLMEKPRPALVMFQGPQAYVRPGWYPAKKEHGKVVPTWSYVSVHVRGLARVMPDMDALLAHVRAISDALEQGQAEPWSVDDAPGDFIPKLARGIVGFTMQISSIEGVWKLNQHRSEDDRLGMIDGMTARDDAGANAIAEIMRKVEMERRS